MYLDIDHLSTHPHLETYCSNVASQVEQHKQSIETTISGAHADYTQFPKRVSVWLRKAFLNAGVISTWGDEEVNRWYQAIEQKGKRTPEMKYPPSVDVEKAYNLTTGDCVVFSLQVDKEMGRRGEPSGQQVHTGGHGASVRATKDNAKHGIVVTDSSARRPFCLEDGKEYMERRFERAETTPITHLW
ncbi:MAG: hypothetical protein M1837_004477 [Sclerophora amabilis]|nr:MAG: hypothetical protein M1837_004477 [Sclerophora amabilis]